MTGNEQKRGESPLHPNKDFHFLYKPLHRPLKKGNCGIPALHNSYTTKSVFAANNRQQHLLARVFDTSYSNSGNELQSVWDHLYIS